MGERWKKEDCSSARGEREKRLNQRGAFCFGSRYSTDLQMGLGSGGIVMYGVRHRQLLFDDERKRDEHGEKDRGEKQNPPQVAIDGGIVIRKAHATFRARGRRAGARARRRAGAHSRRVYFPRRLGHARRGGRHIR
jgi:hypothetical protein